MSRHLKKAALATAAAALLALSAGVAAAIGPPSPLPAHAVPAAASHGIDTARAHGAPLSDDGCDEPC